MFHSNTEMLIDYWRARRGGRGLPLRSAIDPADFTRLLPQAFIAGIGEAGALPLRLAGELLVDLHGRGLKGSDFIQLWASAHRRELQRVLAAAVRDQHPQVISAEAMADAGPAFRLEVLFAPLAGPTGEADRFLGLYQPTSGVTFLGGALVRELSIRAVGGAELPAGPRIRLASLDGRRIA